MTSVQIPNYLRANRKRTALCQAEVAFLLGNETEGTVCRHERFTREPSLQTALAYEAIYHRPARELFSGLYADIEQQVADRAKILSSRLAMHKANRHSAQKCQSLTDLTTKDPDESKNVS